MKGMTQEAAAAAAGISPRSARTWEHGPLPSQSKEPRSWRTRPDPFDAVWETELLPLLVADTERKLQAKTLLRQLMRKHAGQYRKGQLRTLQRRVRDWRALHGADQEVYFPQEHVPGREAAVDFTSAAELGITIAGVVFVHLLFELVLSFSGWSFVALAQSETREALSRGIQDALWELGGVTEVVRTDNLSAATRELRQSRGREPNPFFAALLQHYGLKHTRIQPGKSNENGVVEQKHFRFKSALEQELKLRGSRDFNSEAEYLAFVQKVQQNQRQELDPRRLEQERQKLRPLPAVRLPDYTVYHPVVRRWSTVSVCKKTYSVPARLINQTVEVRRHADVLEVFYKGQLCETLPRLRGDKVFRIDYRHVIKTLVRKPGAFARYRWREEMFPTLTFRRTYDALVLHKGERADVEYVRMLELCLWQGEQAVEKGLLELLQTGNSFDFGALKGRFRPLLPAPAEHPAPTVDLSVYDQLLQGEAP